MISTKSLSRRGFLNVCAAAGASLILPQTALLRPAAAQPALPAVAQADAVRGEILNGTSPLVGERKHSTGAIRVATGHTMTGNGLYNWNSPIEGVSGLD